MSCNLSLATLFDGQHVLLAAMLVCLSIAALDVIAMIYSIARFRNVQLRESENFSYHKLTEVLWSLIPVIILIGSAMPALQALLAHGGVCAA